MSIHYAAETFATVKATRTLTPFAARNERSYDLPASLHIATIGLYFAFLGVMALAFRSGGMGLAMVISVVYVAMAFGTPAMWVRMKPDHAGKSMSWSDFRRAGVETYTGRMNAIDATGQVMILPVLLLFWALAIAVFAAMIR